MIKISIITVVFNRVSTISDALNSVRAQTYPSNLLEHVIVDGASTDGTLDILRSYSSEGSRLISEPDKGIYHALNKGFGIATGEVIGIMHSDDFYADDNVLKNVASIFSDPSVDVVYGDLDYVSKDDSSVIVRYWRSGNFSRKKLRYGWMAPHPTVFIRRTLLDRLGLFNTQYKTSADYDAMLRYFLDDSVRLVYLPHVLVKMRVGGQSNQSIKKVLKKMREDYSIIKINKLGGVGVLICKNFIKLGQFFKK